MVHTFVPLECRVAVWEGVRQCDGDVVVLHEGEQFGGVLQDRVRDAGYRGVASRG